MKTLSVLLFVIAAALSEARAQTIEMRLSVKVILHPTIGTRPPGITDARIRESVTNANVWMTRYSRGYRYRLDEIIDIGGPTQGGANGPSRFYGLSNDSDDWPTNFHDIVNGDARYLLRANMVNMLAFRSFQEEGGGAFPTIKNDGLDTTRITGRIMIGIDPWTLCHELGHFFGLYHTFGSCGCGSTTNCTSQFGIFADDDDMADTLPDRGGACVDRDDLAIRQYALPYASLTPPRQTLVNNTISNVMSYHKQSRTNGVLTPLQLDRIADIANTIRRPFVTGRTLFLSPSGVDGINLGFASSAPRRTFANSTNLTSSAGTDIMLLRPGNYPETLTFRRPVTFRTPMNGSANLGKP